MGAMKCERCDKKAVIRGLCPPHYKKMLPIAIESGQWDPVLINPIGTIRRIQALVANGYNQRDLAARLGMKPCNISRLLASQSRSVHVKTADRVVALFDELQLRPGPSDFARRRAARLGWPPPLAWDEDTIDDPAAKADVGVHRPLEFTERYTEERELGYNDLQILARWRVRPESLVRQLQRYGLPIAPELVALATSQRWQRRKVAS